MSIKDWVDLFLSLIAAVRGSSSAKELDEGLKDALERGDTRRLNRRYNSNS